MQSIGCKWHTRSIAASISRSCFRFCSKIDRCCMQGEREGRGREEWSGEEMEGYGEAWRVEGRGRRG